MFKSATGHGFLPASQDAGNRIGLEPVIFYTFLKYVEHYNKKSI
jgi:hypothetical protein